jgi:pentatricopeptide repeat protein
MRRKNMSAGSKTVQKMLQIVHQAPSNNLLSSIELYDLSASVDAAMQDFYRVCFDKKQYAFLGVEAIQSHLSSTNLAQPFQLVPKRVLLDALATLTAVASQDTDLQRRSLDESFRILQRLISGVGVRSSNSNNLTEKDFCSVLNAFCNAGEMDTAHKIVALHERTVTAKPPGPVSYSILLKGYGRLQNLDQVEWVMKQAQHNQIDTDDVVLQNTLIDAYVNCDAMDKAWAVLAEMKASVDGVKPNRRTYNTILKGYAKAGNLTQALKLAGEMKESKLWDSVTTNTVVHAAVVAGDVQQAEDLLQQHTLYTKKGYGSQHPNVEAYTDVLDAHAKAGHLDKAFAVLKTMQVRGVLPNEVTYMCLMGGLGRSCKLDLALRTLRFMKDNSGFLPSCKPYNALISGLVSQAFAVSAGIGSDIHGADFNARVDQAMTALRIMIKAGICPDSVTASVLVDALGRCQPPRVKEAQLLVDKLEEMNLISAGNVAVGTSLIMAHARADNIRGVLDCFRAIGQPDLVAVNAFMHACVCCKSTKMVTETFTHFFCGKEQKFQPNVLSYAAVIRALLDEGSFQTIKQARKVYDNMKRSGITPDTVLVDTILKATIPQGSSAANLKTSDVVFLADVLKDAEKLLWEDGQLERRKRAVRALVLDSRIGPWRSEHSLDSLIPLESTDDDMFQQKNWNKIDSGFRLWGGGRAAASDAAKDEVDDFLQQHGWNDLDSRFRLF